MPRWISITSSECVAIVAIENGRIVECNDPNNKNIGFAIYNYYLALPKTSSFSKFAIPLIRRTYPAFYASKLVSVQPLSTPVSLIFYATKALNNTPWFNSVYFSGVLYEYVYPGDALGRILHPTNKSKEIINKAIQKFIEL